MEDDPKPRAAYEDDPEYKAAYQAALIETMAYMDRVQADEAERYGKSLAEMIGPPGVKKILPKRERDKQLEQQRLAGIQLEEELQRQRQTEARTARQVDQGASQASVESGEIFSQDDPQPSRPNTPNTEQDDVLSAWKPRKEKQPSQSLRVPAGPTKSAVLPAHATQLQVAQNANATMAHTGGAPKQVGPSSSSAAVAERPKGKAFQSKPVSAVDKGSFSFLGAADRTITAEEAPATVTGKRSSMAGGARLDLSKLGKIPKRTAVASPQSPDRVEDPTSADNERPPQWYRNTKPPTTRPLAKPLWREADQALSRLRSCMNNATNTPESSASIEKQKERIDDLRSSLHVAVFRHVDGPLLRLHRMLFNEDGLPSIFDPDYNKGLDWPYDVKADAEELYVKWSKREFETDILRHIVFGKGKDGSTKNNASVNKQFLVSSKYFGAGDLLNGQWWPYQICALRDGAHGATQGGIYGSKEAGAYSCIIGAGVASNGDRYPDEDRGDVVLYCGTDSSTSTQPTDDTRIMLASVNSGNPVRLLRSSKSNSPYAPKQGFRYDGLYHVVSFEFLDGKRQRHRFRLERIADQDPIRGGDGPATRPTLHEIDEYLKTRDYRGLA